MSKRITLFQAFKSVVASFVGVQSKENYERDAISDENLVPIIAVGTILAVIVPLFLYLIAKIIIWQLGAS
ncbi:MAG: DUF2970 domain-containing protein [Gammaproteobacteria bacterium]